MSRKIRSVRRLGFAAVAGGLVVVTALVVVAIAIAAPKSATGATKLSASHRCLVMAGSGDPAFVKNFNPYTATSLPSGGFVRGAFYEPLIITTAAGGGHQYPWLAQSWKWTNHNKTLTLNIRKGVKWSDGKLLTAADVVYSLTAGRQSSTMDMIGFTKPNSNVVSVKAKGGYKVVIKLRTVDSQFIAATTSAPRITVPPAVAQRPYLRDERD